jgi:hypothetical protein
MALETHNTQMHRFIQSNAPDHRAEMDETKAVVTDPSHPLPNKSPIVNDFSLRKGNKPCCLQGGGSVYARYGATISDHVNKSMIPRRFLAPERQCPFTDLFEPRTGERRGLHDFELEVSEIHLMPINEAWIMLLVSVGIHHVLHFIRTHTALLVCPLYSTRMMIPRHLICGCNLSAILP